MQGISIKLIDYMGDDLRIANVARVSFNKWKEALDERDIKLIEYLAEHKHTSPFRHNAITLRCAAPIFLARQLGKHQVGMSWNEVSRRYVDFEVEYFIPESFRSRPDKTIKQGSKHDNINDKKLPSGETVLEAYKNVINRVDSLYNEMINFGVAPEQARMILPQSMVTHWIWTGTLQAFFNIWKLRIEENAQVEAQYFARELDNVISPIFPKSWQFLKDYS